MSGSVRLADSQPVYTGTTADVIPYTRQSRTFSTRRVAGTQAMQMAV